MEDNNCAPILTPPECVRAAISDIEVASREPIEHLAQISYLRLSLLLCPGVQTVIPNEKTIFYSVEPEAAFQISVAATGNRDAFEMLREICKSNVFCGEPIPAPMRSACFRIISGDFKPPSARGPKPRADFGLFFISYFLAKYLSDAYNLPKTRGDGIDETSAADIVCEALTGHGLDAKYTKIRDFITHQKHAATRNKCNWLIEMMYEPYLKQIGLINRQRWFSVSPFGTFMPIGRITYPRITDTWLGTNSNEVLPYDRTFLLSNLPHLQRPSG